VAGVAAAITLTAVGLSSCAGSGTTHDPYISPAKRTAAPALKGADLTGKQVDIATSRGRTTVVNFWASDCAPCRAESAALRSVALASPQTAFFGVDVERSKANGLTFARNHQLPYPSVYDGLNDVATAWVVSALPQTFVVDASGKVAARFFGAITESELTDMLQRVAAGGSS
jgi:thiol-disulfide isomerase/thioredoxin